VSGGEETGISREFAEAEFERFAECMGLDVDESTLDGEEKSSLRESRAVFVKSVMAGRMTVNENGEPTVTTSEDKELTFHEPRGGTLAQSDKAKQGQAYAKMFLIMAGLTKTSPTMFSSMRRRDLKICEAITLLFLG